MIAFGPNSARAFFVACVMTSACSIAQADTSIDVSGRLTTGFEIEELKHGKAETKAKIKAKTERKAKARIVVEAEASNLERELTLEEAYIDQKLAGDAELEIGLTKKILGLEYELSDAERLPIKRTLIYRKLESFAYVGRETTVRYRQKAERGSGDLQTTASLGYGESLDANATLSLSQEFTKDWHWAVWSLVQSDKINRKRQTVWAGMASLLWMSDSDRLEIESVVGQDPFESEFEKTFGDGKNRYFGAGKALYGHLFAFGEESGIEPYFGVAAVRHDLELPKYNSLEALLGANYKISKALQLSVGVDLVGTNSRAEPEKRTYNDSTAAVEAKYVF